MPRLTTTSATTRAAITKATTTAATSRTAAAAALAVAIVLVTAAPTAASNASFRAALGSWALRVGADARGIGLSAINRHPRRLTIRASRFRTDALRARRALSAITVSGPDAGRGKQLALEAFADYGRVGTYWQLAGRARLKHQRIAATADARLAATLADRASSLLVEAAKLIH